MIRPGWFEGSHDCKVDPWRQVVKRRVASLLELHFEVTARSPSRKAVKGKAKMEWSSHEVSSVNIFVWSL